MKHLIQEKFEFHLKESMTTYLELMLENWKVAEYWVANSPILGCKVGLQTDCSSLTIEEMESNTTDVDETTTKNKGDQEIMGVEATKKKISNEG